MELYRFLDKYEYINPIVFIPRDNALVTKAANNKLRSVDTDGEYFEFTITLEPVDINDPNGFADLLNHRTTYSINKPFDMPCPQPTYKGHPFDTLSSATASSAGALTNSIRINKTPSELEGGIGRFVKFDNRSKIYQIKRIDSVAGNTTHSDILLYPQIEYGELASTQRNLNFHSFNMRVTYINTGTFTVRTTNRGQVSHAITVTEFLE